MLWNKKQKKNISDTQGTFHESPSPFTAAFFSNIGDRSQQEDQCGGVNPDGQYFAVLSDGMGGLSESKLVSSFIVEALTEYFSKNNVQTTDRTLYDAVVAMNEDVNQMLGADGIYKSGATLAAVLMNPTGFHWIAVGDSRIYLLRNDVLICLNEEHNYMNSLLDEVLDGNMTMSGVMKHEDCVKLTSFIGMGVLDQIEYSRQSIPFMVEDKLLLMSDGVFTTITENEIQEIFKKYTDIKTSMTKLEKTVLKKKKKNQDNFTAVCVAYTASDKMRGEKHDY